MSLKLSTPLLPIDSSVVGNTVAAPHSDKLHKAAQDFESLLIGEMLKSARQDGEDGWLGSGESTGTDSAMDMAEGQLAQALSSGKGLGLAQVIERTMQPRLAQRVTDTLPAPDISGAKS